jgi:site-specific DNA-methyltransferase (adenine-specific)
MTALPNREIRVGDCRALLRELPDESVNCVVTSPPYWGLRDYGVDGQLGLEETPEQYVAGMVEVFREVRRVLRADGTCWVNLGDSFVGAPSGNRKEDLARSRDVKGPARRRRSWNDGAITPSRGWRGDRLANGRGDNPAILRKKTRAGAPGSAPAHLAAPGLKPKDLVGIPWRVAFALQSDGWWLRSDIVWHKPNCMPESVSDRPTRAHDYLFLLTKSAKYSYDGEAIKERATGGAHSRGDGRNPKASKDQARRARSRQNESFSQSTPNLVTMRAKRSVWTIQSEPYHGAHFATFPKKLVEPCILAGCPAGGFVLDPFGGSGTVGEVAEALGRRWMLLELNTAYAEIARARTAQRGLFGDVAAQAGGAG